MPDRDWPPLPRRIARTLRSAAYGFSALAGLGVLVVKPGVVVSQATGLWVGIMGTVALVCGLIAFVGAAAHWWQVEWVALWPVGAAFSGYAVLDWIRAGSGEFAALAEAALLTVAASLVFARGLDLLVFSLQVREAREARIRSWRRTATKELGKAT